MSKATLMQLIPWPNKSPGQNNSGYTCHHLPGELIDKITILRIKRAQARGRSIDNIERKPHAQYHIKNLPLNINQATINQLKCIAQEPWNIEAGIRDYERQKDFGQDLLIAPKYSSLERSQCSRKNN